MILEKIRTRTLSGLDRYDRPFAPYKESYTKDNRFKQQGKRPDEVNLRFSSNMLNSMKILNVVNGAITIGFDSGINNDKAAFNLLNRHGKVRDFLGISEKDLGAILREFPRPDQIENAIGSGTINRIISDS